MSTITAKTELRIAVVTIACCGGLSGVSAEPPGAEQLLTSAADFCEFEQFADAQMLLMSINPQDLSASARERREAYLELTAVALERVTRLRQAYQQARWAIANGQVSKAEQLLGDLLEDGYAPIELQISARARLSGIARIKRQAADPAGEPSNTPTPPFATIISAQVDKQAQAREFVEQGLLAIERQQYADAQRHFNMSAWLVPHAPWEKVVVKVPPGLRIGDIPVSSVSELNYVADRQRRVQMNLQLGAGRLLGVQTFGFSGGPQSGVGAPGFVQMPSISRTQIKTSVSLPAHSSGSRSETIVQDYLILFKPRLATAKSPPVP